MLQEKESRPLSSGSRGGYVDQSYVRPFNFVTQLGKVPDREQAWKSKVLRIVRVGNRVA
jgi:hypothetical protein